MKVYVVEVHGWPDWAAIAEESVNFVAGVYSKKDLAIEEAKRIVRLSHQHRGESLENIDVNVYELYMDMYKGGEDLSPIFWIEAPDEDYKGLNLTQGGKGNVMNTMMAREHNENNS